MSSPARAQPLEQIGQLVGDELHRGDAEPRQLGEELARAVDEHALGLRLDGALEAVVDLAAVDEAVRRLVVGELASGHGALVEEAPWRVTTKSGRHDEIEIARASTPSGRISGLDEEPLRRPGGRARRR